MRLSQVFAIALLGLVSAAPAHAKVPFGPQDLFALSVAEDPQLRPDGAEVAYVRVSQDIMTDEARRRIWFVDVKTGRQTPLASGAGSALAPRWSPDGSRLAYVSTEEGRPKLYVSWRATGASALLADLPNPPHDLAWSPDGRQIAFSLKVDSKPLVLGAPLVKPDGARWAEPLRVIDAATYRHDGQGEPKPGYQHLFLISADGGAPRQLTFGDFNEQGRLAWSADGGHLIFSGAREPDWDLKPQNSRLYDLDVAAGSISPLTPYVGPAHDPVVSPDGSKIAYLAFTDRNRGYENLVVHVMNRDGSNDRAVSAGLDRSVQRLAWRADGSGLLIGYVDHGVGKLARLSLDGKILPLAEGLAGGELDRPYSAVSFSAARDAAAYVGGDPGRPGDVVVLEDGRTRRLTDLDGELFEARSLGSVQPLPVRSSFDGAPIDAWMITPPGFDPKRRYPLILEIHGGPYSSYGPVFASELQLYASAGYVVAYANPRGSTSYGFGFADAINYDYPSHDYDDLMSVVDAAVAKPFVDPQNLFVTGGSGGGLLTAWIVGKTDRFRAAVSQKPVIDWTSELLTMDVYVQLIPQWFGKPPWEDPARYWSRSPLSLVGSVKTPTMMLVGTEDRRTPASEAEQFYQALKFRKVPTALVRVPGASHEGLAERPSQEAGEAAAIIAWFERYRRTSADGS